MGYSVLNQCVFVDSLCIDFVSNFFVAVAETFQKEKRGNHGKQIGGRVSGSVNGQSVAWWYMLILPKHTEKYIHVT